MRIFGLLGVGGLGWRFIWNLENKFEVLRYCKQSNERCLSSLRSFCIMNGFGLEVLKWQLRIMW